MQKLQDGFFVQVVTKPCSKGTTGVRNQGEDFRKGESARRNWRLSWGRLWELGVGDAAAALPGVC